MGITGRSLALKFYSLNMQRRFDPSRLPPRPDSTQIHDDQLLDHPEAANEISHSLLEWNSMDAKQFMSSMLGYAKHADETQTKIYDLFRNYVKVPKSSVLWYALYLFRMPDQSKLYIYLLGWVVILIVYYNC